MLADTSRASAPRLVPGIGGTGKTRLVVRQGWTWLGDYPGGVWFYVLQRPVPRAARLGSRKLFIDPSPEALQPRSGAFPSQPTSTFRVQQPGLPPTTRILRGLFGSRAPP